MRGLSLCGSLSARLAGVRIVFVGFFAWRAARSLRAHLDRRGGCACCAGVSVRGSRGWAGLPSVAFWWFWGAARRAAIGFRRVTGGPWGPVYVCGQTMRFPLLWCPRVRSGQRAVQAEHVTVSSVFEHVWQSAMPPLSVLLQGSASSQLSLESVCCHTRLQRHTCLSRHWRLLP